MSERVEIMSWGKRFSDAIGATPDVDDSWAQRVKRTLDDWVRENNKKYPYTVDQAIELTRAYRDRKAELEHKTSGTLEDALTKGLTREDAAQLGRDLADQYKLEPKDE